MPGFSDRHLRVTILLGFVLCITSWNALRVYSAMANWDILREFGAASAYLIATGLTYLLAGLWLMYLLWTRKRLAFTAGLTLAGLYFAWYWFDRLVMQPSPAPNLMFSIIVSAFFFAFFTTGLVWSRECLE